MLRGSAVYRRTLHLLVAFVLAAHPWSADAKPKKSKGKADDLKAQQMDYAKELFGAGVAALESGDYPTALAKFQEGYRYAPDLHLFNYNIAQAAEGLGDCRQALASYENFLALVPKHEKRREVKAKVTKLRTSCIYDEESREKVTKGDRQSREDARRQAETDRALQGVLDEVRRAKAFYEQMREAYPKKRSFGSAARRKKWHEKRVLKLFESHDVDPKNNDVTTPVASGADDACKKAATQEKRNANVYEKVLEFYDTREMYRVMSRYQRLSERRDRPRFEECK